LEFSFKLPAKTAVDNLFKRSHPGTPGTKPASNLHRLRPGFRLTVQARDKLLRNDGKGE